MDCHANTVALKIVLKEKNLIAVDPTKSAYLPQSLPLILLSQI